MMKKILYHNSLSLAFLLLFFVGISGQVVFGLIEYNKDLTELGAPTVEIFAYLKSGHFLEATFENWESEFLQMALFVWLTIFLRQKGSSESKKINEENDVDREPSAERKNAPWPVRKGGLYLKIYQNSLTLALILLFLVSFAVHFYGSWKDENIINEIKGKGFEGMSGYLWSSRFWFESFQNWQSEFLSVFAIVILSIYLRQKGSSQSKPVDAPDDQTGE